MNTAFFSAYALTLASAFVSTTLQLASMLILLDLFPIIYYIFIRMYCRYYLVREHFQILIAQFDEHRDMTRLREGFQTLIDTPDDMFLDYWSPIVHRQERPHNPQIIVAHDEVLEAEEVDDTDDETETSSISEVPNIQMRHEDVPPIEHRSHYHFHVIMKRVFVVYMWAALVLVYFAINYLFTDMSPVRTACYFIIYYRGKNHNGRFFLDMIFHNPVMEEVGKYWVAIVLGYFGLPLPFYFTHIVFGILEFMYKRIVFHTNDDSIMMMALFLHISVPLFGLNCAQSIIMHSLYNGIVLLVFQMKQETYFGIATLMTYEHFYKKFIERLIWHKHIPQNIMQDLAEEFIARMRKEQTYSWILAHLQGQKSAGLDKQLIQLAQSIYVLLSPNFRPLLYKEWKKFLPAYHEIAEHVKSIHGVYKRLYDFWVNERGSRDNWHLREGQWRTIFTWVAQGVSNNIWSWEKEKPVTKPSVITRTLFKQACKVSFGWDPAKVKKGSWESEMIETFLKTGASPQELLKEHFGDYRAESEHHKTMVKYTPTIAPRVLKKKKFKNKNFNNIAQVETTQKTGWDNETTIENTMATLGDVKITLQDFDDSNEEEKISETFTYTMKRRNTHDYDESDDGSVHSAEKAIPQPEQPIRSKIMAVIDDSIILGKRVYNRTQGRKDDDSESSFARLFEQTSKNRPPDYDEDCFSEHTATDEIKEMFSGVGPSLQDATYYLTLWQVSLGTALTLFNTYKCVKNYVLVKDYGGLIAFLFQPIIFVFGTKITSTDHLRFWKFFGTAATVTFTALMGMSWNHEHKTGFSYTAGPKEIIEWLSKLGNSKLLDVTSQFMATMGFQLIAASFFSFVPEHVERILKTTGKVFQSLTEVNTFEKFYDVLITQAFPAMMTGDPKFLVGKAEMEQRLIILDMISSTSGGNIERLKELLRMYEKIPDKMVRVGQKEILEYSHYSTAQVCAKVWTHLDNFKTASMKAEDRYLLTMLPQLTAALNELRVLAATAKREQPFCVGSEGPAGVGKTTIVMPFIISVLSEILKIPNSWDEELQAWVPAEYKTIPIENAFFDNINVFDKIIYLGDLGLSKQEVTKNQYLKVFQEINDSGRFVIPRSGLPEKQGQYYDNVLTLATSNTPTYGLLDSTNCLTATRRRMQVRLVCLALQPNGQLTVESQRYLDSCGFVSTQGEADRDDDKADKYYLGTWDYNINDYEFKSYPDLKWVAEPLRAYARQHVAGGSRHFAKARVDTSVCQRCGKTDMEHTILPITREKMCPLAAMWIKPKSLVDIVVWSLLEEFIMWVVQMWLLYTIYVLMSHYGSDNSFSDYYMKSSIALFVIRIFIENAIHAHLQSFITLTGSVFEKETQTTLVASGFFKYFMFLAFTFHVSIFPLPFRMLQHLIYNCVVYYPMFIADVMMMWEVGILGWLTIFDSTLFGSALLRTVNAAMTMVEAKRAELVAKTKHDMLTKVCIGSITVGTALYAIKKFVDAMFVVKMAYTMDNATEKDIKAVEDYEVKYAHNSHFTGPDTVGRTAQWANHVHYAPSVIKPTSDTIPRNAMSHLVEVEFDYLKDETLIPPGHACYGYLHGGRLYTVAHTFEHQMPDCNFIRLKIKYVNKSQKEFTTVVARKKVRHLSDCAVIPVMNTFQNSIERIADYHPDENDIYAVFEDDGKMCKYAFVAKSCMPITDSDNMEEGIVMRSLDGRKGRPGQSGKPVFVIRRGKTNAFSFIGVQSAARLGQDEMLVAILPMDLTYTDKYTLPGEMLTHPEDPHCLVIEELSKQFKIESVSSKYDVVNHYDDISNVGVYLGSLSNGPNVQMRTSFRETDMYHDAISFCPELKDYGPPYKTSGVENGEYFSSALGYMAKSQKRMFCNQHGNMMAAASIVFRRYLEVLPLDKWVPLSTEQVFEGAYNVNAMDQHKSMGIRAPGKKKGDFMVLHNGKKYPKHTFMEKIAEIEQLALDRHQMIDVSVAVEKDEIKKKTKFTDGFTRNFFAGDGFHVFFAKKYLAPLFALIMHHRDKLGCQVGIDAVGKEWHEFLMTLSEGDMDAIRSIDEDAVGFDTSLFGKEYSLQIAYSLAQFAPYFRSHPHELLLLSYVLSCNFGWVTVLGRVLIMREGLQNSGGFGTAQFNSLQAEIITVYKAHFCGARVQLDEHGLLHPIKHTDILVIRMNEKFEFYVHFVVKDYGDDVVLSSGKLIHWFNHDTIQIFGKIIGMPFTTARKGESKIQPKSTKEILFLKRVPRWEPILDRYVGCLEPLSITKMLAYCDTNSATWKHDVLYTAIREASFHGDEYYNSFQNHFQHHLQQFNLIVEREKVLLMIDKHIPGLEYKLPTTQGIATDSE